MARKPRLLSRLDPPSSRERQWTMLHGCIWLPGKYPELAVHAGNFPILSSPSVQIGLCHARRIGQWNVAHTEQPFALDLTFKGLVHSPDVLRVRTDGDKQSATGLELFHQAKGHRGRCCANVNDIVWSSRRVALSSVP